MSKRRAFMNKRFSALCLAFLLPLSACGTDRTEPAPPPAPRPSESTSAAPTPAPTPTPTPEPEPEPQATIWGEQALRAAFFNEDGTVHFDVDLSLPFAGGLAPVYREVNDYYAQVLEDCAARIPANLDAVSEGPLPYYWYFSPLVPYENDRFLCTAVYEAWFGGGVVPVSTYYACFDKETGQKLRFDDFFTDPRLARQRMLPHLREALYDRYNWRSEEMLSRASELMGGQFYLTDEGLVLHYNVYDIGSYADGGFQCLIPFDALAGLWALPIGGPALTAGAEFAPPLPLPNRPASAAKPTLWGEQSIRADYLDEAGEEYFRLDIALPYAASPEPGYAAINDFYAHRLAELRLESAELAERARGVSGEARLAGGMELAPGPSFEGGRFVSLSVSGRRYAGGASPGEICEACTFDRATGEYLPTPDRLFSDWPAVREPILTEIHAQLRLPRGEVVWLEDAEALADAGLDRASFLFTNHGLQVTYPAMCLSDWVHGAQSFFIPYEILED